MRDPLDNNAILVFVAVASVIFFGIARYPKAFARLMIAGRKLKVSDAYLEVLARGALVVGLMLIALILAHFVGG